MFRLTSRLHVMMAVGVVIMAGCASGQYPAPPLTLSDASGNAESYSYVIGEGDQLNIFVWGYEDLSVIVPVRPDGRITTRLVEDMPASGKTPTQLARDIEERYREFVNRPVVTISIEGFVGSSSQQIKVVGASDEPQSVPYESGMMLLDLLIESGGLDEFSSGNRSRLIRTVEGERKTYSLRIDDLIRKGDITANVPLRPGDIVIIPESWF